MLLPPTHGLLVHNVMNYPTVRVRVRVKVRVRFASGADHSEVNLRKVM